MKTANILSAVALALGALAAAPSPAAAQLQLIPEYCMNRPESRLTFTERAACNDARHRADADAEPMPGRGPATREDVMSAPHRPMPAGGWHDPAFSELCPRPRRMTDNGCQ